MPSKLCVQPRGFARSFIVKGKVDDNGQGAVQGLHSFSLVIIWCHVMMRKLWPLQCRMLHQIVNIFHSVRAFTLDTVMCIPWRRTDQRLAPRLHYCFSAGTPLSLHPFPSLVSICLNQLVETQGRSWRLNEACFLYFRKRTQEGFCAQESHRVLLSFICTLETIKNKQNNYYIWEQSDKLVIFLCCLSSY